MNEIPTCHQSSLTKEGLLWYNKQGRRSAWVYVCVWRHNATCPRFLRQSPFSDLSLCNHSHRPCLTTNNACISEDKTTNAELLIWSAPGKHALSNWFQKSRLQIDPPVHMAYPPNRQAAVVQNIEGGDISGLWNVAQNISRKTLILRL